MDLQVTLLDTSLCPLEQQVRKTKAYISVAILAVERHAHSTLQRTERQLQGRNALDKISLQSCHRPAHEEQGIVAVFHYSGKSRQT